MIQDNYKIIKDSFFNYYKSLMDFSRLMIEINNKKYTITISRKLVANELFKVNVTINNQDITGDNFILNEEQATTLIEDIRNDFKLNHYISYSSLNTSMHIQTIQNTNFTINIHLLNEEELEKAIKYNDTINRDETRNKALTKV